MHTGKHKLVSAKHSYCVQFMILASDLHFGAVSNESLDALTKAVLADPEKLLVVAGRLYNDKHCIDEHYNQFR